MKNHKLLATAAIVAAAALAFATPGASAASGSGAADPSRESSTIQVFQQTYNNPNATYLGGANCLVPLTMADFTIVASTTACGITSIFSPPPGPMKLTVPVSWPVWGAPVQTEVPNPEVLWTNGGTILNIRFSSPRRWAGFEISPPAGTVGSFKANYIDASGNLIGTINKTISAGKARLIGAKMFPGQKVAEIQISGNIDFAIARLRYKP